MRIAPLFVLALLLSACPPTLMDGPGDGDAGSIGDGDGDEEADGGACADGACSTDGGAVGGDGDGDGDEEVDGGACADGACSTDGGAVGGDGDGDGDAPADAGVDEGDAGAPFVGDGGDGGDPVLPGTQPGSWSVDWIHGAPNCNTTTDPPLQVHEYNADTFVIRQSKCVNFEGPFIYLLFGEDFVFMQDTGATSSANQFPIQATVEGIIDDWVAARGRTRDSIELLVTHSHSHGDHVQGDGQFSGQPNTTVVGTQVSNVQSFFGFTDWPYEIVTLDLGGRVLEVTGIPGHHNASVAVFDENAGLLLTGDTVYPGHLFVSNYGDFRTSINHMADMAATRTINWVLGTHVEMSSTPGVAYQYGSTYQPDEHTLQMPVSVLLGLAAALPQNTSCVPLDDVSVEPAGFGCN